MKIKIELIFNNIFYHGLKINLPKGVGALYVIMDAIKRKVRDRKEEEEIQRKEEEFQNKINKGRTILKPLTDVA